MPQKKRTEFQSLRCPTCGAIVLRDDPDMPFCSDRCRVVDLGKWASGAYRISSPILDPEVLEGLDERHRSGHSTGDDE
ncbi:MAG TPA: DNA gyrase inhibitor YacG [Acidobacteriaceae bacterium]|nr:DNA gyrase inhibitor YacG [Acidobacteriaceae bacterium]